MSFANVAGHQIECVTIHVPGAGVWFADVDFAEAPEVSGRVTLTTGDTTWSGTIDPERNGVFGDRRRCRIVAGAGNWGALLPAKGYHNDAGVKARDVAADAAREAGETLGAFSNQLERLGNDYARIAGPASNILTDTARGSVWWVDRAGVTHVGIRATATVDPAIARVVDYSPDERIVTLAPDSLAAVDVGSVITDSRLPEAVTITALEIRVTADSMRVIAWCGAGETTRAADAFRSIVGQLIDARRFGTYRYRVVSMNQKRANVQAVKAVAGVPDLLSIDQWPGVAGAHATLKPGGEVLVQFIGGDFADPVITSFVGGHKAVPTRLELGGSPAADAARKGDGVEVPLPPAVFSGTMAGAPVTGVITFPIMKTVGVITGGSSKVGIAT